MSFIYQPRGKAFEYSPLALNIYKGCSHACAYCFAPSATFTDRLKFSSESYIRPRPCVVEQIEKDAAKIAGDRREILLSFTSDAYQPCEEENGVTRKAIEILKKFNLRPTILTKGGKIAQKDFDLLGSMPEASFAVTLTCAEETTSEKWEPGASMPAQRIENIREAKKAGIKTWVSFEPVIYPEDVFHFIEATHRFVDLYKVGKLNYHAHAKTIDWPKFRSEVVRILSKTNSKYILKKDLLNS